MRSDRKLLDEFASTRSDEAFRALVDRHLDLVHSIARRVTLNDDLARDVSQAVFLKLATRPDDVPRGLKLLAWLHRTTRHKAIDLVRSENRRRRRERIASQQHDLDMESQEELDWKELEPVIDSALAKLSEPDRTLVLSRYYKKNSHSETARELGISEDAARMRTRRALEKLRGVLSKRGIATTSALLATAVSTNAVTPAPASLATSISSSTLAVAETTTAASTTSLAALFKTHLTTLAVIAISAPVIALQFDQHRRLDRQAEQLQSTVSGLEESGGSAPIQKLSAHRTQRSSGLLLRLRLDEILAIPDPQLRLNTLIKFANSIDAHEIPAAVVALRESTPDWDQDAKITAQLLFTRWGKTDSNAALRHVEGLDYLLAADDMTFVLAAVAAEDPKRAIAWLDDPNNKHVYLPVMGHQLAGTVAKEWARRDPEAALKWALSIDQTQRAGAMTGVLGTITSTRSELFEDSIRQWQTLHPSEANDWLEKNQ